MHWPAPLSALLILFSGVVSGCVERAEVAPAVAEVGGGHRPVVVALVDSGINPYHDVFRAALGHGAEQWAEELGADILTLSHEGDYTARVEADADAWSKLEPNKLYAFAGTRVLGISISRDSRDPVLLDIGGHGTATASIAAREDPDALVVMVQIHGVACDVFDPLRYCPVFASMAPAIAWIAGQSWIDVVTVSLNYPGNPPTPSQLNADQAPYVAAVRRAHEQGKILVNSAGNHLAPPLTSQFAGPPEVIVAGGARFAQRGDQLNAGKGADVLANFTEWTAMAGSTDAMQWNSGTSFSSPLVAGTISRAITILRMHGASFSPTMLRDALNASALAWEPMDWRPTAEAATGASANTASQTLPLLSPVQSGWGYVHGGMADEIARRVLENDLAPPPEKAQTAAHMAKWQSLREAYWRQASA